MATPMTEALQRLPWRAVPRQLAIEFVNELSLILTNAESSGLTGPAHEALVLASADLRARVLRRASEINCTSFCAGREPVNHGPVFTTLWEITRRKRT